MPKPIKVYVAGKVSKESVFGTHHWRDNFLQVIEKASSRRLINVDPTKNEVPQDDPEQVFAADLYMISISDLIIVYLSDDISVGGSQEILLAKYLNKPVIGLAPYGGKFNGSTKEFFGKVIHDFKDPFVFTTCDVICSNTDEIAQAVKSYEKIKPKNFDTIAELLSSYKQNFLPYNPYVQNIEKL